MSHLKQVLLILLVLSTLGYSSAWAFDEHVMEQLGTELDSNTTVFGDSQDEKTDADIACDHCCHISSHLVAIFPASIRDLTNGAPIYLLNLKEDHISYIVSPDLKPPRV